MKSVPVLLAALAAIASSVVAAPTASADPDPHLTVLGVEISRPSVAVSGLNTVPVQVRLRATYTGEDPREMSVHLHRTAGPNHQVDLLTAANLTVVEGTYRNGVWGGQVDVPSTANGKFQVKSVSVGHYPDISGSMIDDTPVANGPELAVTGYHLPRLTAQVIPRVVPFGSPYTVRAAIVDSATGKPYGTRIPVWYGADVPCAEGGFTARALTNTSGVVDFRRAAVDATWLNCIQLPTPRGITTTDSAHFFPLRPGIIAARPATTHAKVNQIVSVTGSVAGPPGICKVALQRRVGATQWRGVSLSQTRQSGRFNLLAQPPYRGVNTYRAYLPTCGRTQAGYSKPFTITAS